MQEIRRPRWAVRPPRWLIGAVLGAAATGAFVGPALAHEGRHVSGYEMQVGFETEPAFEGLPNAAWIRVTRPAPGHGEIFASPTLQPGASYTFTVPESLLGDTIPYHSHLDPAATGSIRVMPDAPDVARVAVTIRSHAMEPGKLEVRPGTAIVWTNASDALQALASGEHQEDAGPGAAPAPPSADAHADGVVAADEHADGEPADEAHTHADAAPVLGLQDTLHVEITHLGSGTSRIFAIEPVFDRPGAYRAPFMPTVPGQYRFRVFGTVRDAPIDATFDSGPSTFDDVQDRTGIQFPDQLPSMRELAGVAATAQTRAQAAEDTAGGAYTVAVVGVVVGALGLIVGAVAALMTWRRGG